MTRHKSHSPAQTPSTAAREHARRARRNMLTPPTSSPYFPQRMTPSGSSFTGPGYSQDHAGFQTYYSTVTSSSNLSSPPDAEYCNTSRESSVPESASSDGKDDDVESEASEEMDVDKHDLPIKGNVYWDKKLDCPARPISKPSEETVYPGPMGPRTKCICGELVGGKRVPLRSAKKHHYNGPKFTFDEKLGAYVAENVTMLSTPFHTFEVNGKPICQPITVSKEDYLNGKRGANLSAERSVPQCAHFPVTGLVNFNVPFVRGRICHRAPSAQSLTTRIQDQARFLCLIENEVRADGSIRRRMNIHAPPADWNDPIAISHLNRWRAQFRQRKLGVTSREARKKWTKEALDYLVERLARDPTTYRIELARDVTKRFGCERSEHAVSCAIDNHKLRRRADELRTQWEAEGLYSKFGEVDADILLSESDEDTLMDEVPDSDIDEPTEDFDDDVKEEDGSKADDEPKTPPPQHLDQRSLPDKDEEDQHIAGVSSWLL